MAELEIYQLTKRNSWNFMSLDFALSNGFNFTSYEKVWSEKGAPDKNPEDVFVRFNCNRPLDFKAHSLSVSDIVVLDGKYYYCDDIGFENVSELVRNEEKFEKNDVKNTLEQSVKNKDSVVNSRIEKQQIR